MRRVESTPVRLGGRGHPTPLDRWIARKFRDAMGLEALGLVLWDGERLSRSDRTASQLRVRDRAALWRMALRPGRVRINVLGGRPGALDRLWVDSTADSGDGTLNRS